jgi:hypothetical protein
VAIERRHRSAPGLDVLDTGRPALRGRELSSRFNEKLNPNVAMEWEFMRAFRRPVTYLVEKDVNAVPADVAGLIQGRFDWTTPQADIPGMVKKELAPWAPAAAVPPSQGMWHAATTGAESA